METRDDRPTAPEAQAAGLETGVAARLESYVANEVASGFAHELNQPLAAIAAYAESAATLLRRQPVDLAQSIAIVEAIAGQALRAGDALHRLRAGLRPPPASIQPIDATAFVEALLPSLRVLGARHGVEVDADLDPVPSLMGDVRCLHGLLTLLLRNACDAVAGLPASSRRVTIFTRTQDESVEISVADPGPGLSQAEARHVFQPFSSTKPGRSGVSLAVCRQIAADLGGELIFNNVPPGGASLRVRLPASEASRAPQ